jgi:petrobactin synthase
MEQLHCLINCIVHIIAPKVDYRPFLFGNWDAPLGYTKDGYITYYSYTITDKKYFDDYRNLYGDGVSIWYDRRKTKGENLEILKSQLINKNGQQFNLVQVDLYHLFYERGSYHRKHQPHFLIINAYSPNGWEVTDPYYLWEGIVPESDFSRAFIENPFGGGLTMDRSGIREADPASVARQFENNMQLKEYPLVDAFKNYIMELIAKNKPFEMEILETVLSQLKVLYKTKISYSYAYSYFADALQQSVQSQTELVDKYLNYWSTVTFLALKSCMTKQKDLLIPLLDKINHLYTQEKEIKEGLWTIYECWKRKDALE